MSPTPPRDPVVQARLAARATRLRRVRRRVVKGAAAIFAAAWIGIFAQLASGHDPGLGSSHHSTSTSSTTSSAGSSTVSAGSSAASAGSSTSSTASAAPTTPSPVTTQQS
jgi:hypothetical protein